MKKGCPNGEWTPSEQPQFSICIILIPLSGLCLLGLINNRLIHSITQYCNTQSGNFHTLFRL